MTSGKKHLQAFAAEYFHARRSPLGVSRATRQKAAAITTLIIDTKNLATGDLRFYRTIAKEGSDVTPQQAAVKALAGHATAESSVIMRALGADAPHILPIAAPNDIVLGSVWHRGEGFEAFWIGSLPSILHYADSTENVSYFIARVRRAMRAAKQPVRHIVVDAGAIDTIDYTAAEEFKVFCTELHADGVTVSLAHVSPHLRVQLEDTGIAEVLGENAVYSTLYDALHSLAKK